MRRDVRFGPVVLVGAGGLDAESCATWRSRSRRSTEAQAEQLLRSLAARRFSWARAAARRSISLPRRALAALSRFAAAHPEIAEVEVNPLLVRPTGAVGLDARIILEGDGR